MFVAVKLPSAPSTSTIARETARTVSQSGPISSSGATLRCSMWSAGHDERVAGEERAVIEERADRAVRDHPVGRHVSRDDLAEETAGVRDHSGLVYGRSRGFAALCFGTITLRLK